jgi:hypothetical protein
LQRLQAERPQPQPPAPQLAETESPTSPIGFVPQTYVPEPTSPLSPAPGPRHPREVRVLRTAPEDLPPTPG